MRKYIILLFISLFLSACATTQTQSENNSVKPDRYRRVATDTI